MSSPRPPKSKLGLRIQRQFDSKSNVNIFAHLQNIFKYPPNDIVFCLCKQGQVLIIGCVGDEMSTFLKPTTNGVRVWELESIIEYVNPGAVLDMLLSLVHYMNYSR